MKLLTKLVSVFLCTFVSSASIADEGPWKKYPYHEPDSYVYFPTDEGAHPHIPGLEWWYLVIHAKGKLSGDRYAILVTHFNNSFRFFTVTNLDKKQHMSRTTEGTLLSQIDSLDLVHKTKYGEDYWRNKKDDLGQIVPFEYIMETFGGDIHLKAQLDVLKRPMMVGETGFVQIGLSGASWYYSQTQIAVKGEISYEGFSEPFTGIGWMDHQWGPFAVSPVEVGKSFETYEWFCVQLENGVELMISNVFDRFNRLSKEPGYGGVQIFDQEGNTKWNLNREFVRTHYWQDPESGHYVSMGWELKVPEWDLELRLLPEMKEQMVHFPMNGSFWEGAVKVSGLLKGASVQGKGFGELIHRFALPKLKLDELKESYNAHEEIALKWKVENPDDGNPLHYDVEIILVKEETSRESFWVAQRIQKNQISFKLADLIDPSRIDGHIQFVVHAYSVDRAIHGKGESKFIPVQRK